jgi:hypothetical protein
MILLQRFYKVRAHLCRDCGSSMLKRWTGRTLVQGWWGYISFFVNWFVLVMNLVAAIKLSRLPHPSISTALEAFQPEGSSRSVRGC